MTLEGIQMFKPRKQKPYNEMDLTVLRLKFSCKQRHDWKSLISDKPGEHISSFQKKNVIKIQNIQQNPANI